VSLFIKKKKKKKKKKKNLQVGVIVRWVWGIQAKNIGNTDSSQYLDRRIAMFQYLFMYKLVSGCPKRRLFSAALLQTFQLFM
jgi:F0F1-type ATP synthase membrane subunit a